MFWHPNASFHLYLQLQFILELKLIGLLFEFYVYVIMSKYKLEYKFINLSHSYIKKKNTLKKGNGKQRIL